MSYTKAEQRERQQFIDLFVKSTDPTGLDYQEREHAAELLLRHSQTHGRLAVEECNGPGDYVHSIPYPRAGQIIDRWQKRLEKRQEQIEKRITAICAKFGLKVECGGDPRGYTIKMFFPGEPYNTMGGRESGWGIPQFEK